MTMRSSFGEKKAVSTSDLGKYLSTKEAWKSMTDLDASTSHVFDRSSETSTTTGRQSDGSSALRPSFASFRSSVSSSDLGRQLTRSSGLWKSMNEIHVWRSKEDGVDGTSGTSNTKRPRSTAPPILLGTAQYTLNETSTAGHPAPSFPFNLLHPSSTIATSTPGTCELILEETLKDILNPSRLAALEACDVAPVLYNPYSFYSYIFSIDGRNLSMIISPMIVLFLWGLLWQILFLYAFEKGDNFNEYTNTYISDFQHALASVEELILPLITPVSLLLSFRLGRAAVRFWDARQAAGKLVEICRANIGTIGTGLMAPIRLKRKYRSKQMHDVSITRGKSDAGERDCVPDVPLSPSACNNEDDAQDGQKPLQHQMTGVEEEENSEEEDDENSKSNGFTNVEKDQRQSKPQQNEKQQSIRSENENTHIKSIPEDEDHMAMALLCEYARWLATFSVAAKHFLRPELRPGWDNESYYKKRRFEIGPLLSDEDSQLVIMEYEDDEGKPIFSPGEGERVRDQTLVVLNRLHELVNDIAFFPYAPSLFAPTPQRQAAFYQQINDQVNILYGAYGAMERIKGTPLPFVYTIHLRTFLLLYLFLVNWLAVAKYGWVAIFACLALNWSLLGIEAAAVECERPFNWNSNHLMLGKVAITCSKNIGQALKELRW